MTQEHTPGPWSVNSMVRIEGPNFGLIASVRGSLDAPATTANARLIAAAPDLLAVVAAMLDQCQPGTGHSMPDVIIGQALQAIAKARGAA